MKNLEVRKTFLSVIPETVKENIDKIITYKNSRTAKQKPNRHKTTQETPPKSHKNIKRQMSIWKKKSCNSYQKQKKKNQQLYREVGIGCELTVHRQGNTNGS